MAGRTSIWMGGLFLIAIVLSGCLDEAPAGVVNELEMHGHSMVASGDFELGGNKCVEAGGVSTYGGPTTFADTYDSADVSEEVNSPYPKGNPTGIGGDQWANWHMGFKCESATVAGETQKDYIFGYVGQMVEAPAWDPGGADQHFIVTGLGFGNGTFADALRDATSADITHAYEALIEWYVPKDTPRSAAYIEFSDVEKGIYMQYTNLEHYRMFEERTIRFWWGVPADGSESTAAHGHNPGEIHEEGMKWHPVYFDLYSSGGHQYTTPPFERAQMFCHLGNDDHGTTVIGGVCEPTHSVVYEHDALTFTLGKVIEDVTLDKLHVH
ncbi:MAG TPA: hypothetical protein VGB18_00290 [Candidatus Thermoplasmatota archaeon]